MKLRQIATTFVIALCFLIGTRGSSAELPPEDLELSGSGDGSGSGFGSGDDLEPDCILPTEVQIPKKHDIDVLPEIRCHLACLQHYLNDDDVSVLSSTGVTIINGWPILPDSVLQRDCQLHEKVQECRTGCLKHSESPSVSVKRCGLLCYQDCVKSCDGEILCDQIGKGCLRQCDLAHCDIGCNIEDSEFMTNATSFVRQKPSKPSTPPFLTPHRNGRPGQFHVRPSTAVPEELPQFASNQSITGFIFQVLNVETDMFGYYWLPSFEDALNLEAFSCYDGVLVQYAAVNVKGRSEWSDAAFVNVHGEPVSQVAENPDRSTFTYTVEPDERFDYWKHGVITLSWESPKDTRYLSHYAVILFPSNNPSCGMEQGLELEVPKERTSVTIAADTPTDGPVNGCTYHITVASRSINAPAAPPPLTIEVKVNVDNPVPLNVQCSQQWSLTNGTFLVTMNWTVPDSSYLHSAIEGFEVMEFLYSHVVEEEDILDSVNGAEPLRGEIIDFMPSVAFYSYETDPISYDPTQSQFQLQLLTKSLSPETMILVPTLRTCSFSARPPPPPPVQEVILISEMFEFIDRNNSMVEIEVSVMWFAQSNDGSFDDISSFEVRVLESLPSPTEGVDSVIFSRVFVAEESSAVFRVSFIEPSQPGCLFLQARSVGSLNTVSDWTKPLCLQVMPLTTPTATPTPTPTATPTTPTTPTAESGSLPRYLYVVIAVGGALLTGVAILCLCVSCSYLQNKRIAKQMVLNSQQSRLKNLNSTSIFQSQAHYQGSFHTPVVKAANDKWEIHPSMISIETRLGEGAFGDVYEGTVQGMASSAFSSNTSRGIPKVAVKLLSATASNQEHQNFLRHIQQAKHIGKNPHPHVVSMVACVTMQQPACLVLDLPEKGSLLSHLETCRKQITMAMNARDTNSGDSQPAPYLEAAGVYSHLDGESQGERRELIITATDLISYAHQITEGMEYLAYLGVVHGDLACRNVFIDGNSSIKISDFGLSNGTEEDGAYLRTMAGRLPWRWMAIESLTEGKFSCASDVWGFGVTLWEIVTLGGFPYSGVSDKDLIYTLQQGQQLEKPDNCSQEIYKIMLQCWTTSPTERPSFCSLGETFRTFLTLPTSVSLVTMTIDEQKPYYRKANGHERLHRTAPHPASLDTSVTSITNPYMEHTLPQIEEEREGSSEREESVHSETASAVAGDVSSTNGSEKSTDAMLKPSEV